MAPKGQMRIRIVGDADGVKPAMSKAVSAVQAGAVAMGAAFTAALVKTMDVEAAGDKMAAQLGLTAKESQRLGGIAGKLYADAYGDSIDTVNNAVGAVISSIGGMRTASAGAVEDITAKTLDLATAFEMDVARSAQVAGQMITTGLARDATHALDLLTVGLQRVPAAVREDLVDALDEYAPFMQSLGLTGEKAMNLLVNSSQKGAFGLDKLGDSLKEFTIRATDMSAASKVGFDILGVSQEDMAARFLAGGETARVAFEEIITGLRGIKDPVAQSQAALALFGTPLEDLSTSEIPKFLDALDSTKNNLGQVAGATDAMGATLNDNAKTNLTAFWRSLQMHVVDILGNHVIPFISTAAMWLRDHLGPAFSALGSIVTNYVGPALRAVGSFISDNSEQISFLSATIGGALIAYGAYRGAVMIVTGLVKAWSAATKIMTAGQIALNIAMSANPIGLVVIAIGALVGAIWWLWENSAGFRDFFIGAWNIIKGVVEAVGDAIGWVIDIFGRAIRDAKELLGLSNAKGNLKAGAYSKSFGGGKALGGPVSADEFYVVGERGPEMFFPGESGRVLSNVDTQALMAQADTEANSTLNVLAAGAHAAAPSGGGSMVQVNNFSFPNYLGSKEELKRELRNAVRTEGRGSAQRFFGVNA